MDHWADNMNENASLKMNTKERRMYGFLQKHAGLVDELCQVMEEINMVLAIVKHEGLSSGTMKKCRTLIFRNIIFSKMTDKDKPYNISSDIIESYFGYDKSRMSKNKRAGFTSQVLTLALRPFASDTSTLDVKDIKGMLDNTTINDVKDWCWKNLGPNQMANPKRKLAA